MDGVPLWREFPRQQWQEAAHTEGGGGGRLELRFSVQSKGDRNGGALAGYSDPVWREKPCCEHHMTVCYDSLLHEAHPRAQET